MAAAQSPDEIQSILDRIRGRRVAGLQVLGINSLKSHTPLPDALVGETVTGSEVADRTFRLVTTQYEVAVDLQRTGNVIWLEKAEPYRLAAGVSRPTIRLLLEDGSGVDLTEPAKTKRITVTLSSHVG